MTYRALVVLALISALGQISCTSGSAAQGAEAVSLADREAIEATLQRYTRGLDRLDPDLYVSSFAADGVLTIDSKKYQGHEALRAVIATEKQYRQSQSDRGQPPRTLFHFEANSTIKLISAAQAQHEAYWWTASRAGEKPEGLSVLAVGSSTDKLLKTRGQWLIVRREIRSQP